MARVREGVALKPAAELYPQLADITWLRQQTVRYTDREIAAQLGLNVRTVRNARCRLGLQRRQGHQGKLALSHAGGDHDVIETVAEGLGKCPKCRLLLSLTYIWRGGRWHVEEGGRLRYQAVELGGEVRRLLVHLGCGVPVWVLTAPGTLGETS